MSNKLLPSFLIFIFIATTGISQNWVQNSILSAGNIYKCAISHTGLHSIDNNYLSKNGISATIDNIAVYGNKGGMLPTANGEYRTDDLQKIKTYRENGRLVFYAEAASREAIDSLSLSKKMNIYDNKNYIFIKIEEVSESIPIIEYSDKNIEQTESSLVLQRYEIDRYNILSTSDIHQGSGQNWYGDYYKGETKRDYISHFDFNGLDTDQPLKWEVGFASRASSTTPLYVEIDDYVYERFFSAVSLTSSYRYASRLILSDEIFNNDSPSSFSLNYSAKNNNSEAWLDYIQSVHHKFHNALKDHQIFYVDVPQDGIKLTQLPYTYIWDVTDYKNPILIATRDGSAILDSQNRRKLIGSSSYLVPESAIEIENQNLHNISEAELIIIHPDEFLDAAETLGNHRRIHNSYNVEVVSVNNIYNEFSSGRTDPTAIRDFLRMVWKRGKQLKYVLLMGDGTYDIRNIKNIPIDHNKIPVYETTESEHGLNAFPYDDFYGLLETDEGEGILGDIDIAVGRLPVLSPTSAMAVVNKIIHYDSVKSYGPWRTHIGFSADDEDSNRHLKDVDGIAKDIEVDYKQFNQNKIYFDAFEQQSTIGEDRYYDASDALNRSINQGQLVFSYLGHGGPRGWAQERVLKKEDIDSWENLDNLPLLITATCTFAGFDDPEVTSMGEYSILKPDGGAIALLTTVRAVFADDNERLTRSTYYNMFEQDHNGNPTFGDIIKNGKNERESIAKDDIGELSNIRKFSLLGDPSQQLALPQEKVITTSINGSNPSILTDTISALEPVHLEGNITNRNYEVLSDFNGIVYISVYDKKNQLQTLGQDPSSYVYDFSLYRTLIYNGAVEVKNGKFEANFIVPKDINYLPGNGRISYYAYDNNRIDASGYEENFIISGTYDNVVEDNKGPEIDLFIDDRSFIDGGNTSQNPTLIVDLQDELGINVTGISIGHDLTATLDGKDITILNDFYLADQKSTGQGTAQFDYQSLDIGLHEIEVQAWDLANNTNKASITFYVAEPSKEMIDVHDAYPNPTKDKINVSFDSQLGLSSYTTSLEIYDFLGRLVYNNSYNHTDGSNTIEVDLTEEIIANGVYFYKIIIQSGQLDNTIESNTYKFVKI